MGTSQQEGSRSCGSSNPLGIIPRSLKKIFNVIESRPNTLFQVTLTYVELYLDKFVDLLDPCSYFHFSLILFSKRPR